MNAHTILADLSISIVDRRMGICQSEEDQRREELHKARLAAQRTGGSGAQQRGKTKEPTKLKLLCLSGNRSNFEITQMQVSHLSLDKLAVDFLDGPFRCDEPFHPDVRAIRFS